MESAWGMAVMITLAELLSIPRRHEGSTVHLTVLNTAWWNSITIFLRHFYAQRLQFAYAQCLVFIATLFWFSRFRPQTQTRWRVGDWREIAWRPDIIYLKYNNAVSSVNTTMDQHHHSYAALMITANIIDYDTILQPIFSPPFSFTLLSRSTLIWWAIQHLTTLHHRHWLHRSPGLAVVSLAPPGPSVPATVIADNKILYNNKVVTRRQPSYTARYMPPRCLLANRRYTPYRRYFTPAASRHWMNTEHGSKIARIHSKTLLHVVQNSISSRRISCLLVWCNKSPSPRQNDLSYENVYCLIRTVAIYAPQHLLITMMIADGAQSFIRSNLMNEPDTRRLWR
jgi:hypothetical protein